MSSSEDRYRRPAEAQLPRLIGELRQTLLDGFDSRREVLFWLQELSVATVGQIDPSLFAQFATEFRPDSQYNEGTILATFLTSDARTRELSDRVAKRTRQQWAADIMAPASSDALRALRPDAVEYTGEDGDSEGERINDDVPHQRPALNDLHQIQNKTLTRALGDGLDDRAEILDWGDDLLLATRGEPLHSGHEPGDFIDELYNDASGDRIMCSTEIAWKRHRQLWVCRQLLPGFNRAVRDLTGKSSEEAGEEKATSRDYKNT